MPWHQRATLQINKRRRVSRTSVRHTWQERLTINSNPVEVRKGRSVLASRRFGLGRAGRKVEVEDEVPNEGRVGLPRSSAGVGRAGGRLSIVLVLVVGGNGGVPEDLGEGREVGGVEDGGVLEAWCVKRLPRQRLRDHQDISAGLFQVNKGQQRLTGYDFCSLTASATFSAVHSLASSPLKTNSASHLMPSSFQANSLPSSP